MNSIYKIPTANTKKLLIIDATSRLTTSYDLPRRDTAWVNGTAQCSDASTTARARPCADTSADSSRVRTRADSPIRY